MELKKHYGEENIIRKLKKFPRRAGRQKRKKAVLIIRCVFSSFLAADLLPSVWE